MISFVYHYYIRYKKVIVLATFLSLLNSIMTVACSQFLKTVIKETLNGQDSLIVIKIVQMLCLTIVWVVLVYIFRMISGTLSIHMTQNLRQDIIQKIMNMRYDYLIEQEKGIFLNNLNGDISDVSRYFDQLLFSILLNGLSIVVILLYLLLVDWKLMLISMIWIPLITLAFRIFLNNIAYLTREKKKRQDILTAKIQELFECYETEKSYNLQQINLTKIEADIDSVYRVDLLQQKKEAIVTTFSFVIQSLPILFCSIFAAGMAIKGKLAVENFISFIVLLGFIASPISNFTSVLVDINKAGVSVERLRKLINAPEECREGITTNLFLTDPVIKFKEISFSYHNSNRILEEITFEVKKGERIAFVGSSGSGKTTLLNLILGLYEPESGEYLLYGTNILDLDIKLARGCFSIVSQETFMFPDTIRENLLYGNRDASEEEIQRAVKDVGLDYFIESLPDKYETVLGENGINLSGGQKQRFAIARALLRNSDIIIFDEPTSALDAKAEEEIMKVIDTTLRSKTIITVAHKLNTILDYDKIYLLERGKIKEQGSHEELLLRKGLYFQLFYGRESERREIL
ncbi:ABC transporter ATP-binding protein [Clostridium sp. E02]|uniref:ABC transporter ATP-binding protein n=1 Tax=Clostridium sp. E02 TaxID=2487134 RepID=UPI000F54BD1B|nr:ABC transporter ATP-binding protein [Clostridium sp. E02]